VELTISVLGDCPDLAEAMWNMENVRRLCDLFFSIAAPPATCRPSSTPTRTIEGERTSVTIGSIHRGVLL
jgi:hypothetical protein